MQDQEKLAKQLEQELSEKHGPLMTGDSLEKALGYISKAAWRQSLVRKTVPVPVFKLEHRRGKYALTKDVAAYLAQQRYMALVNTDNSPESTHQGGET